MYFILKISLDDKGNYTNLDIVGHTFSIISTALILLENTVRSFILEEGGKDTANDFKIININGFQQICEPIIDTMLVYRIDTDPHKLHIYKRKTKIIPGTFYGQSIVPEFHRTHIFSLVEYKKITSMNQDSDDPTSVSMLEMVSVGSTRIRVPKQLVTSPMRDVIAELKSAPTFNDHANLKSIRYVPLTPGMMKTIEQITIPEREIINESNNVIEQVPVNINESNTIIEQVILENINETEIINESTKIILDIKEIINENKATP